MDNVTHSLVGLAVGEAAFQVSGAREEERLRFWWVSALANNFPDLDIFWHTDAGYLLDHRGYTHTLAGVLPEAALLLAGVALFSRKRGGLAHPVWMLSLAVLGVLTHVLFDWFNSYGVHPWWPISGQWRYGDTLFILEPWLWLSLAPGLIWACRTRGGRALFAGVALAASLLSFGTGYVPWWLATVITLWGGALALLTLRAQGRRRAALGPAALAIVTLTFFSVGTVARRQVQEAFQGSVDDIILSPMPADPVCWNLITVQHDPQTYTLRRGTFSPFGAAVRRCPGFRQRGTIVPLKEVPGNWDDRFYWEGEIAGSLPELRTLAASDCHFRAFLHFARAPYLMKQDAVTIAGDLRFDFGRHYSFAAQRLPAAESCPQSLPPWGQPRADWLR